MNRRTPIPWTELLSPYPGGTTQEKALCARQGKTFPELARELGQDVNAVKTFIYRTSSLAATTVSRGHVVVSRPRPDYAAILGGVIRMFAQEQGFGEDECREWIAGDGMMDFARRCTELKIPLFVCRKL